MESSSFTVYIILHGAVRKTCFGIGFRIKIMVYTLTKLFPLKSIWNFYSGNGDCLRWQKKAIIQWTSPVGSTRRINWYRKGSTLLVCSTLRSATNPLRAGPYTWSPIFQHFHRWHNYFCKSRFLNPCIFHSDLHVCSWKSACNGVIINSTDEKESGKFHVGEFPCIV